MTNPDPKKWLSVVDAIEHIIRTTGCTRMQAAEQLAEHIKSGRLPTRKFKLDKKGLKKFKLDRLEAKALSPEEAARALEYAPESVTTTLADFSSAFCLTPEELYDELCSGRLRARPADNQALLEVALARAGMAGARVDLAKFIVTGDDVNAWIDNPLTPARLKTKWKEH